MHSDFAKWFEEQHGPRHASGLGNVTDDVLADFAAG